MSLLAAAAQQQILTNAATVTKSTIEKHTGTAGVWDAGANSVNVIPANTDGEIFFTFKTATSLDGLKMFGLANVPGQQVYNSCELALYVVNAPSIAIYESGTYRGVKATGLQVGQVASVFRNGTTGDIIAKVDGTPIHTRVVQLSPTLPFQLNVSFRDLTTAAGFFEDVYMNIGGTDVTVNWENFVNTRVV